MATNDIIMNQPEGLRFINEGETITEQRVYRKQRLAAAFRLFGKFGFDEGVAGHITVRDPEHTDHFWVNPMGQSFKQIKVSDLLLVNHKGDVVEGAGLLNGAAFAIHSAIHMAREDVVAAAHSHSIYGKAWSSLRRPLSMLTQDACAFYNDHVVYDDFTGVVLALEEGRKIAQALGTCKACILSNHGLLSVGHTVEEAAWWFITMERNCQAQLLAEAAGTPKLIRPDIARLIYQTVGSEASAKFAFQSLYDVLITEQADMFD